MTYVSADLLSGIAAFRVVKTQCVINSKLASLLVLAWASLGRRFGTLGRAWAAQVLAYSGGVEPGPYQASIMLEAAIDVHFFESLARSRDERAALRVEVEGDGTVLWAVHDVDARATPVVVTGRRGCLAGVLAARVTGPGCCGRPPRQ